MTGQHDPSHERLLAEILSDARSRASDDARARLEDCPTCRAELQRLAGLVERLDGAGRHERALAAEVAATPDPGEQRLLEEWLRSRRAHPRLRRRALVALAAGLLALLVGALYLLRPAAPEPVDPALGPELLMLVRPVGAVAEYAPFEWTCRDARARIFEVHVRPAADPAREIATSGELDGSSWAPDPEETKRWPDEIVWELRVFDAGRQALLSLSRLASRSH